MTNDQLVRIPGRRLGLIRCASLWDAGDHLLSVNGTTFSESYRRYYYADIKSIVLQKGPRLGSTSALLFTAFLLLIFISIAVSPGTLHSVRWLWVPPAIWLAYLIYVSFARSCRVLIFTRVSTEELHALFHRRAAAKALPKILNKIAEAQGTFEVVAQERLEIPTASQQETTAEVSAPVSHQIIYSTVGFALLLFVSAGVAYWYRSVPWTNSAMTSLKVWLAVLSAPQVASGVWAIFKLVRVRLMNSLRICIFIGLGLLGIRVYLVVLILSMMSQRHGAILTDLAFVGKTRYWLGTVDSVLSLLVGLAVLITLTLVWREDKPAAIPEPGGSLSSL